MPGILCEHCVALCCRYIALPIDTPQKRSDFDDIRWYLLHEGVSVFIEDGDWYICITTTCRHLQPDRRCGIYETRPRICRDYSTEGCDYHSGDYGWEQHFTCSEHLDEYLRLHWRPGRKLRCSHRNGRRRRPALRARPGRKRGPKATNYLAATCDVRGVPLPVLGVVR